MKIVNLGKTVATAGVSNWVKNNPSTMDAVIAALHRHENGDWGEVDKEDWELNNQAVESGNRLLSSYVIEGEKIWIITEWDRSSTTVLFPSEY